MERNDMVAQDNPIRLSDDPGAIPEGPDPAVLRAQEEARDTRTALTRAQKEYPKGLVLVFQIGKDVLRGKAIFQAAYAAEKISAEHVQTVIVEYYRNYNLEPPDIPHATESEKKFGSEKTRAVLEMGFRRGDIPPAADSLDFWPNLEEAVKAMSEMNKMLKRVRADIHEMDIRYAAMTLRNLDADLLERALRDRHKKNEREPWARGASIPILAHCYKLSAPHTGPAIDACIDRHVRRERIGLEVLSALSAKFGRKISPPKWMS